MQHSTKTRRSTVAWLARRQRAEGRSGAAVVEFALIAPVLIAFVLGVIDVGQYVNVGQVLSGISRQAARKAIRIETLSTTEVESAVQSYLTESFPALASNPGGYTVSVTDKNGATISGTSLGTTASGDEIRVTVVLDYDAVRWMSGTPVYTGQDLTSTSVMRRE